MNVNFSLFGISPKSIANLLKNKKKSVAKAEDKAYPIDGCFATYPMASVRIVFGDMVSIGEDGFADKSWSFAGQPQHFYYCGLAVETVDNRKGNPGDKVISVHRDISTGKVK